MDGPGDNWQAAAARQRFSDVIDAAVDGRPQFVRRRDGKQVVVVSQEYFDSTKPRLKTLLLNFPRLEAADEFERLLEEGRAVVGQLFLPREGEGLFDSDGDPGHERPE